MKKKRSLIRLFLIILSALSVYSCVHDELTEQPTENFTTAQYASKSLWKEDQVYITKVQQVFLKHANLDFVSRTYGELHWDYAMSFGQFGEKYLLVPVVKDNKAVLLMEAVRKGNKVYFYEKDDAGLLDFFNHVMYSVITRHSEVLNANTAESKYVCSTRTIIVGCPPGVPDCEPISQSQMVCSWEDDSGGIPPKSFDPLGDPNFNGGGGGGIGYNYPDPPEQTPCDKTKSLLDNANVQSKINELKNQSTMGGEKGVKLKSDGTSSGMINGGAHNVNFGDKTGYQGGYHNHTVSGIPMLSPPDIEQLLQFALAQGDYGDPTGVFIGMVAPNGMHYVMWFNGNYNDALLTFSADDLKALREDYREWANDLTSKIVNGTTYINSNGSINNLGVEKLFFKILNKMGLDGKVNLQRVESNGTANNISNISLNENNQPISTPCP